MDKHGFDTQAETRAYWKKKNWYYHKSIEDLVTFMVPGGERVLEIGSGTGDLLFATNPKRGVGIDINPSMIKIAGERYPSLEWRVMDAAEISLKERFDYVILSDVLGLFDDVEDVLQKLGSLSHSRTRVIVTYYNYLWEPLVRLAESFGLKSKQPLQHWLSEKDIANLLYLSGFEVVKQGKKMMMPFYIPLLSQWINRFFANVPFINRFCLVQYLVARPATTTFQEHTVSIIIPARNEKGNIESAITRLPKFGVSQELIFVEGHSTDGTLPEIERVVKKHSGTKRVSFAVQGGKGKGDAVRKGFSMATGEILMILDADLTVPPEDLPKFYKAMSCGRGEFINGSRLVYPMEKQAMRFLNALANKFFSLVFSWFLGQHIKDTLCGTKVLFRADYERIARGRPYFGDFDPFGDFDLLLGAAKLNLKIVDLPIHYRERTYGSTNISRFRHGWLLLKMCLFAARKLKLQ